MNPRLIEERTQSAYNQYQELASHNTVRAQVQRWDDLGVDSMGYLFRKGRLIEETFADIYEGKDWKLSGVTTKTRWDHQLFYGLRNSFLYKKECIKDPCIVFTDSYAEGYFQWHTDALPRLFYGIQAFPSATYMVPYPLHKNPTVKDSLAFFFGDNRYHLTKPKVFLQLKDALFSQKPAPFGYFDVELMTDYIGYVRTKLKQFPEEKPTRLFISRERAGRKRLLNEACLYPLLEAYGFKIVHFEAMSWIEQVKLCWNAEIILGSHGAGLTNLIYTKPQTPLIELISDLKIALPGYSRLSAVLKYPYFTLSSPFIPAPDFDPKHPVHANANFNVNPDALESLFKEIGLNQKL
jgi:hypothetical protein